MMFSNRFIKRGAGDSLLHPVRGNSRREHDVRADCGPAVPFTPFMVSPGRWQSFLRICKDALAAVLRQDWCRANHVQAGQSWREFSLRWTHQGQAGFAFVKELQ